MNVKVYGDLSDGFRAFERYADAEGDEDREGFTEEWVREHLSDGQLDSWFWEVCAFEFEMVEQDAAEIFGSGVKCWQEGRSGGWVVVDGLPELEDWDAVALAKWRRFERFAKAIAADVPYQLVSSLYLNVWQAERAEAEESARAASLGIPTRAEV